MTPAPRSLPDVCARGSLWAIVLAGGQGIRLRSLTRHVHGDDRPKQFAVLSDNRSLLRQTLDRVALLIPPERTVVVTMAEHLRYVAAELDASGHGPWVLPQPEDRGTAAALLWPAHWIHARDPEATLAVFPSDHFVLEDRGFMGHVEALATFVESKSDYTVLLGAQPTEPETDYGWIEPGERIGWARRDPVYRVRRFREKPSAPEARSLFAGGALWNTLVFVARVLRGHRPRALGAPASLCPGADGELLTLDARGLAPARRPVPRYEASTPSIHTLGVSSLPSDTTRSSSKISERPSMGRKPTWSWRRRPSTSRP
jgi:dTDP-glucose pyrophosphorylase